VSASFHGRDLFAPAAARLAMGGMPRGASPIDDWHPGPEVGRRYEVIYVDGYGNLVTGLPADSLRETAELELAGHRLRYRRVFGEVSEGELFWYRNSMDQVEIAANAASAAELLGVGVGARVEERA
jgi:S-adenosylmethionine hydrolase